MENNLIQWIRIITRIIVATTTNTIYKYRIVKIEGDNLQLGSGINVHFFLFHFESIYWLLHISLKLRKNSRVFNSSQVHIGSFA